METPQARGRYHGWPGARQHRPLVLAHRGASAYAPENTAAAFALARRQGADGAECDLLLCASGELVVCHDPRLSRLCGVPLDVADTPLETLRELPVLAGRFPGTREVTPTLEEAIEAGGPDLLWNLELKADHAHEAGPLAAALAAALPRLPLQGRVIVSSFHPYALLTLRRLAPAIPTAYLWESGAPLWHGFWWRVTATAAVHPEASLVTRAAVERWHAAGRRVNVWTVDEPEALARLASDGVDGVITNRPDVALATLERRRA